LRWIFNQSTIAHAVAIPLLIGEPQLDLSQGMVEYAFNESSSCINHPGYLLARSGSSI
jgi:hypothetical protein